MTAADVDELATRVRQVPGVADLSGGIAGEVATYLPGRRVAGIREHDGRVEVHLVLGTTRPAPETAADVRRTLAPLVDGQPIDVIIADVQIPEPPRPPAELEE